MLPNDSDFRNQWCKRSTLLSGYTRGDSNNVILSAMMLHLPSCGASLVFTVWRQQINCCAWNFTSRNSPSAINFGVRLLPIYVFYLTVCLSCPTTWRRHFTHVLKAYTVVRRRPSYVDMQPWGVRIAALFTVACSSAYLRTYVAIFRSRSFCRLRPLASLNNWNCRTGNWWINRFCDQTFA